MFKSHRVAKLSAIAAVSGGAITATVLSLMPAGAAPAAASQPTSGAWGFAVDGKYAIPEQAPVNSTGENSTGATGKIRMGTYLDGKVTVQSVDTAAKPYYASSKVAGLVLNGQLTVTSAYATCDNGKVSGGGEVTGRPTDGSTVKIGKNVSVHNADGTNSVVGLLIVATGPDGKTVETIRVAAATCGAKATTPPTTTAPTTSAPTQAPTTSAPTQAPTQAPTTSAPTQAPTTAAPTPPPVAPMPTTYPTHLPVTG